MADMTEAEYELVDLFGQMALFADYRIDRSQIPSGLFCYELRHGDDDDREPATMESHVRVNFFGTVITGCDFGLDQDGSYLAFGEEDFGFAGEEWSLANFQEEFEQSDDPLPAVLLP